MKELEENKRIEETMANWQLPFDADQPARAKAKIMAMAKDSAPVIEMNSKTEVPWLRIAAAIALLVAIPATLLFLGNTNIANLKSTAEVHTLPNGSEITLNPGSELAYNKFSWKWDRTISFSGEGYFDVVPGSQFSVETEKGLITVLGTEFSIWADDNDLLVHCTEGAVKVETNESNTTLSPGEMVQHSEERIGKKVQFAHDGFYAPRSEITELTFEQAPLSLVMHELEIILKKEISCELKADELLYTGVIDPSDLNTGLDVLCKPFNAKHTTNQDGSVLIYE